MKKSLLLSDIYHGYLKGKASSKGWALCIGAGTSLPAFPSWDRLVKNLLSRDSALTDDSIKEIMSIFSLDALIQASYNVLNLGEKEFVKLLSDSIYDNIKSKITSRQWRSVSRIFTSIHANRTGDTDWIEFNKVRDELFKNTSAYKLAKIIIEAYENGLPPNAIMSFNAEPLLHSLINSFQREPYIGKSKKAGEVKELVDVITSSTSSRIRSRIPYHFCHGALLNTLGETLDYRLNFTSKLVFSESSYLQLANTSFSWQSNNFLNICSSSTVIFIGVSLTDSNMRKWLTWIQNERRNDIGNNTESTHHFWLRTKPKEKESEKWIEASVVHLGVRIIWLDSWDDITKAMNQLLGL